VPKWKEVDDDEMKNKKKSKKENPIKGKSGEQQEGPHAAATASTEEKLEDDWVEVEEKKREGEGHAAGGADEQPAQVELRADRSWKGTQAENSSQLEEDSVSYPSLFLQALHLQCHHLRSSRLPTAG
jgi:hypothetical protein